MEVSGHIQVEGCVISCAACQGTRCIAHLLRICKPIDDSVCSVSGRRVNIAYPLNDPMVIKIAEKHNKHPAQVQSLLLHLKAFTGYLHSHGGRRRESCSLGMVQKDFLFDASSVLHFVLL